MRLCMFVFGVCAALVVSTAGAHGPQIQITVDDPGSSNKIVTRQMLPGNTYSSTNGLTAPASVYVMPVLPVTFIGNPVARVKPLDTQVFGPGFTYGYDQFVTPGGTRLFTANLELHVEGLQIWDGSAFVGTGAGMEQLGLLQSSSNLNPDSLKTIMGGDVHLPISIAARTYTSNAHSSVRYQLLGDGISETVASRDGVYLVTMELSGLQTTPSLTPSDTFYYILGKNVAPNVLTGVVDSFIASKGISASLVQYTANAVPEPGSAILVAWSVLVMSALSRSRRHKGRNL